MDGDDDYVPTEEEEEDDDGDNEVSLPQVCNLVH